MSYTSAPVPRDLFAQWTQAAERLGYGRRGRLPLLRVMLEVAEAHPTIFRKR